MIKSTPSQDELLRLLQCDAATGRLFWKERPPELFKSGRYTKERSCLIWNTKNAGNEAFTANDGHGYLCGAIFGSLYRAHRIIWKIVHNEDPPQIDHINGVRSDNRISNLRAVSNAANHKNMKRSSANSSGHTGVLWFARTRRWRSEITVDGRNVHLGYFLNLEDAVAARKEAEVRHGYHANHGAR